MPKKRHYTRSCLARNCRYKTYAGSEVILHKFPKNPDRSKAWVEFAENPQLLDRSTESLANSAYLCQHHFTEDQYASLNPRRLIPTALPSIPASSDPFNFPSTYAISSSSYPFYSPSFSSTISAAENFASSSLDISHSPPLQSFTINSPQHDSSITSLCPSSPAVENPSSEHISQSVSNPSFPSPVLSSTPIRHDRSLLRSIGLRRNQLTPKKRLMYQEFRRQSRRIAYLLKRKSDKHLLNNFDHSMRLLVESYLRNINRKPKGRRWTNPEKLFFLTLQKRSPQTYSYMRKHFLSPSSQTLLSLLNGIPFRSGINPWVMKHLTFRVSRMSELDKYCVLLFDEMSIKPCLLFNSRSDCIEGFEDHGNKGRSDGIAREALVFMVRGLRQKWKQPVAFYFSQKSTPGVILADLIKEVLGALQSTGLKVVATVCDMGSNNTLALRTLGYSVETPFFNFNGQEIFTLHNPPHLLKCTRNMFLKYAVKGEVKLGDKVFNGLGRWSHIKDLHDSATAVRKDCMVSNIVKFSELTDAHLNPTWRQKMNVRLAAEVFSEDLVQTLEWSRILGNAPVETCVTTSFLCFIHNLFQSFNGVKSDKGDGLKNCVSDESPHIDFWEKTLEEMQNWSFVSEKGKVIQPKSSKGWVITIKAAKLLWVKLKEAGFTYLEPQQMNQDPLENFFGSIRLHCGANHNPTVEQFASAFKTSIIKDISSHWSLLMNSFPDDDALIAELEEFTQMNPGFQEETEDSIVDDFVSDVTVEEEEAAPVVSAESFVMDISVTRCCSRILKDLLKNNSCSTCITQLTADTSVPTAILASVNESMSAERDAYFPSEKFVQSTQLALSHLQRFFEKNSSGKGIGSSGKSIVLGFFSWLHCEVHGIKERAAKGIVRYALNAFCRSLTKEVVKI